MSRRPQSTQIFEDDKSDGRNWIAASKQQNPKVPETGVTGHLQNIRITKIPSNNIKQVLRQKKCTTEEGAVIIPGLMDPEHLARRCPLYADIIK